MLSDAVKDILARCSKDLAVFAKVIFPGRFSRPFDPLHREVIAVIEEDCPLTAIAGPRGTGKTSLCSLAKPAKDILFADCNFVLMVGKNGDTAMLQSENLKRELTQNPIIRKIWGDIKTENFSKEIWSVRIPDPVSGDYREIAVMPRGAGQQVRGLLFKDSRPDRIFIDDVEDAEAVYSEMQRQKFSDWYYGDLLNCVDRGSDAWRILHLDTIKHERSLLSELIENPDWRRKQIAIAQIVDDRFVSNIPNMMDDAAIMALYEEFKRAGKVSTFYREYLSESHAGGDDAAFQQRYFKSYEEKEYRMNEDPNFVNILVVDPAKTTKAKSAETGIVCWSYNVKNESIYVRKATGEKLEWNEIFENIVADCENYNIDIVAVEVTSLHEFIIHPLKNALAKANIKVELIELHARGGRDEKGKHTRIKQLRPYYIQGQIYHNTAACLQLENQLLSFPRSKRWDVMDPFGYLPQILEESQVYLGEYKGHMDDRELVEKEFAENDYSDMQDLGDFRLI